MAPRVGFEPTTNRLTADDSSAELPRIKNGAGYRIRTDDLRFTKPLHYHCANPALCLK
jgi:hypothetical protein